MEQAMEFQDDYAEQQFSSPDTKSKAKTKKATRAQTASRQKKSSMVIRASDAIERDYGLTEDKVEIQSLLAQLEAAKQKCAVMDSLQEENQLLRKQL